MYTLITAGAAALLSFTVSAQQLDLIKNMCVRFDHQCRTLFAVRQFKGYSGSNLGQQ